MADSLMNNECERRPNLTYDPDNSLRKEATQPSQEKPFPDRSLEPGPLKYEGGVFPDRTRC